MITAAAASLTAALSTHVPAELHAVLASPVLANQRTAGEGPTPGVLGFVMTFVAALLVVALVLAMTTSLRRVKHRAGQVETNGEVDPAAGPDTAEPPTHP